jgi:hypothetical protein
MTFAQLQTMVSYLVDDLNFTYFTPAQVQFWLNNGLFEVQKRLLQTPGNWYVTPFQTTTVASQNAYLLPSNFLKLHRCEYVSSGTPPNEVKTTINPITIQQQDQMPSGIGTPCGHYITQNIMYLFPAPDTTNLVLRVYYSYLVAPMVNPTDVPDCPLQYHEWIGLLAAHDAFIKDQRDPSTLVTKMSYYEKLLKEDSEQRSVEEGRQIVVTQGDSTVTVY